MAVHGWSGASGVRQPSDGTQVSAARFQPMVLLLEAKLRRPTQRVGIVERSDLLARLGDPAVPRVVSLVAPAGYGKTTLLVEWAAQSPGPVAWLTLDDLDNDPAILLSYVAAALDRIHPIDAAVAAGLTGTGDRVLAVAVPRLSSDLFRWPEPALLILDDAHRITDTTCLDAITMLIDHLPPGFRVAIAGRSEPRLLLARYRAQRELLEIGADALALDVDEAAALTVLAGRQLDSARLARLVERTEGWAAGIYLATLTDPRAGDAPHDGSAAGADRYIADYLRSELGRELDAEITFLTRTSILEVVTPPVADAVTGQTGAGERLARIARRNLLVSDLGGGASYHYHNLLREYLEAELRQREPQTVQELHRRASAWYLAHGNADRAIEHALASGDAALAGRHVTAYGLEAFHRGEATALARWLSRFATADFERQPTLAVLAGWIHLLSGRSPEAEAMAEIADRTSTDGWPAHGAASFTSQRALLRAVMCRHGARDMLANASLAVAQEQPDSPWRSHALFLLGAAHLLNGDAEAAETACLESVESAVRARATRLAALAMLAGLGIAREDWDAAAAYSEEATRDLLATRYEGLAQALMIYAVNARVAVHRGDLEGARRELVRAQLVRPLAQAIPWMAIWCLTHLSRAYIAVSDISGARQAIRDAEDLVRRQPLLGSLTTDLLATRRQLDGALTALAGPSSLTTAELRVLILLPTYLSFEEIGDRLLITRNTVKSHAMSIYGKLQASSRGEAVERAVELGLLEPYPALRAAPTHGNGAGFVLGGVAPAVGFEPTTK